LLDLIDCSVYDDPTAIAASSEYNRLATKATTTDKGAATTIAIVGFFPDKDVYSGNLTGNYKYSGHDDATTTYNEILALDSTTNTGFNFTIAANSGW
jgi:hypothetical protein